LSESLHHGKLLHIPCRNGAEMNAHPAPPPPAPTGSLGIWLWLLLAVGVVVVWWLGHTFRR
jgi:hypothetical protein